MKDVKLSSNFDLSGKLQRCGRVAFEKAPQVTRVRIAYAAGKVRKIRIAYAAGATFKKVDKTIGGLEGYLRKFSKFTSELSVLN